MLQNIQVIEPFGDDVPVGVDLARVGLAAADVATITQVGVAEQQIEFGKTVAGIGRSPLENLRQMVREEVETLLLDTAQLGDELIGLSTDAIAIDPDRRELSLPVERSQRPEIDPVAGDLPGRAVGEAVTMVFADQRRLVVSVARRGRGGQGAEAEKQTHQDRQTCQANSFCNAAHRASFRHLSVFLPSLLPMSRLYHLPVALKDNVRLFRLAPKAEPGPFLTC